MRYPLKLKVSALLLALIMPLAQGQQAAESEADVTVESLSRDMENLNQELTDFSADRRDQLMTDIEDVLADIDARISALESRVKDIRGDADRLARAKAQTALASLRRERARVLEWHQRMQDSANFTWESMKDGFNDAFDKLSEAWQEAEQNVRAAAESQ